MKNNIGQSDVNTIVTELLGCHLRMVDQAIEREENKLDKDQATIETLRFESIVTMQTLQKFVQGKAFAVETGRGGGNAITQ